MERIFFFETKKIYLKSVLKKRLVVLAPIPSYHFSYKKKWKPHCHKGETMMVCGITSKVVFFLFFSSRGLYRFWRFVESWSNPGRAQLKLGSSGGMWIDE